MLLWFQLRIDAVKVFSFFSVDTNPGSLLDETRNVNDSPTVQGSWLGVSLFQTSRFLLASIQTRLLVAAKSVRKTYLCSVTLDVGFRFDDFVNSGRGDNNFND